jgi:hypothetical protein
VSDDYYISYSPEIDNNAFVLVTFQITQFVLIVIPDAEQIIDRLFNLLLLVVDEDKGLCLRWW